jgi:pilus assembly protein CpaB
MRTGTVVSLGASAMLGVGALIVAKLWLPQSARGPQSKADAAAVATVPVVVASADIPYGGKLDAAHLMIERLPVGTAPKGAYSATAQIISQKDGPPIALTPIVAHEPILPAKLSGAGARPTLAAVVGDGLRAYTIGVSDVAGGGGHVLPGDRVDVILTCNLNDFDSKNADKGKRLISGLVLQDVRVLGMDLNADPTSTTAAVAHTATLEVAPQDAEKLALAATAGALSLALRRTGSAEVAAVKPMAVFDLGAMGAHVPAAPHRATGKSGRGQVIIHSRSVIVVHGDTATPVEVPSERYGAGA